MRLVTGQDEIIANFVSAAIQRKIHPPYTALGWVDIDPAGNWKLMAGAVFNDFSGASIELTFCGRLTRQVIREIGNYVFGQLNCLRLTARTARNNKVVCQLLSQHGWQWEATLKHFYGSTKSHSAVMFRLDAEVAQRWMNGKRSAASSIAGIERPSL